MTRIEIATQLLAAMLQRPDYWVPECDPDQTTSEWMKSVTDEAVDWADALLRSSGAMRPLEDYK